MVVTKDTMAEALEHLHFHDNLAVDTETTGLRMHDRLFSIELASAEKQFHFDKRILGEDFDKVKIIFDKERTWYLQNAKFDMRMLHWEGIVLRGTIIDLEVLVRLYKNDVMSTRLKDTAKLFGMEKLEIVDEYITKNKLTSKVESKYWSKTYEFKHYDKVPIEIIGEYGPHDARITFDLCKAMLAEMDIRSRPVFENECALTKVCFDMEMHGVLLDREYAERMLKYESGLIHEAEREFLLSTGQLYTGSKGQLLEVFTKAGETIPKTAKGNPSLTGDILDDFTSPVAKMIQRIRYYEKRCSTYYSSFLDLSDDQGRLHADIRQAGTTTGRFSYRDPNLQNVPKEDDPEDLVRSNIVRGCFIPEKDHVLVQFDYSQQEYRLMLAYANQWDLIAKVMGGMDVHDATAQSVGVTRKIAKVLNFAISYGSGPAKIAGMLGIPVDEAFHLRKKYFAKLPMVNVLLGKVQNTATSRGHVYNWMGRKLHLPGGMRDLAYQVPNHLIQGGGADICKKAMVDLANTDIPKRTGAKMIKQVHDALIFQWPKSNLDMIPLVEKVMVGAWPGANGMAMAVDVKWSDKSLAEKDMVKWQPIKNS